MRALTTGSFQPTAPLPDAPFPRLLVVTDFGPEPISGGALLWQMLRGYPADRLHWWTSLAGASAATAPGLRHLHGFALPARLRPTYRAVHLKGWMLERFWVPRAARHLRALARQLPAEQLWVQLSDWAIPVFRRSGLVGTHRCHVSLWDFHDSRVYCRRYGQERARRFARWAEELLARATTGAVVSRPMQAELAARTGRKDLLVFHSGIERAQLERLEQEKLPAPTEVRIAYAGSIIVPEVFALFLRALDRVRRRATRPVTLHLFSQRFAGAPWFDGSWMRDHGFLDEASLDEHLRQCAWGLVPMALTDDNPRYNRFSFPNKFGTYLAAGLPLLVLAHRESSAARMFREYPAGTWCDRAEPEAVAAWLEAALAEPNPCQRYRAEMLRCARTEFDAEAMRRRLWACLGVK